MLSWELSSDLTYSGWNKMAAIFQMTFSNAFSWLKMYKFSPKFVPKGPINNIPALVPIMAWCQPGDKPLSEPMMVSLLRHICVTRPQWVKQVNNFYLHLLTSWYRYKMHRFNIWFAASCVQIKEYDDFVMTFNLLMPSAAVLTHQGRMMHICLSKHGHYWFR